MSLFSTVKRANLPGPAEESILLRVTSALAVIVGIAACWTQGELPVSVAGPSIALIIVGNLFSFWRRHKPLPWLKLVLAIATVGAFVWFIPQVTGHATAGDLGSVEGPLAILFTWIQVTHAFDVPARRDLAFSLAGSATLMAVAAAQSQSSNFGVYVVIWSVVGLTGLLAMWGSMGGGVRLRLRTVAVSVVAVLAITVAVIAVLPAPHASTAIILPSSLAGDVSLGPTGGLVGGGPDGTEPARAATTSGNLRVGGFLGFAGPLDTAIRGALGNQVVLRVRADVPSFWTAETFNQWERQSWIETAPTGGLAQFSTVSNGPPFSIPIPSGTPYTGRTDFQTFYVAIAGPNLVFHAGVASQVWFPAQHLYVSGEGTIRSGTSMGAGSVYTVESQIVQATPQELESATTGVFPDERMSPAEVRQYTQLPPNNPYANVRALARRITAHDADTYDKIMSLEQWIGAHTKYTTDIPPLTPGQDTVEEFLFGNRRGYCEQISTSLAVMLRTLGIPTREATGYVPGSFNPITDLYEVQAKDAHAWVQVWFPGYGWQNFDPTANVPLANPSPGQALAHDLADAARRIPLVPVTIAFTLLVALSLLWRWRRDAPRTWAAAISAELLAAARLAGLRPDDDLTLVDVARQLDDRWPAGDPASPPPAPSATELALAAERAAYGGVEPDGATQRAYRQAARRIRSRARALRGTGGGVNPPGGPAPGPSSPLQRAGAGSP